MAEAARIDIPEHLLADPISPELVWEAGSLGSPVLALKGGHPEVLKHMADLYANRFRKGWRDFAGRLAVFMAPSMAHERATSRAGGLVQALCIAQGIAVVDLRSTTLKTGSGGGEPDESFYIGDKAERYLSLEQRLGATGADEAFESVPADLAVEVEHTRYDREKRSIYQEAGVAELWEMSTNETGGGAEIVNLQAPGGPQPSEASHLVPGVRADGLGEALRVLREIGGQSAFLLALGGGQPVAERLLAAAGGKRLKPAKEPNMGEP